MYLDSLFIANRKFTVYNYGKILCKGLGFVIQVLLKWSVLTFVSLFILGAFPKTGYPCWYQLCKDTGSSFPQEKSLVIFTAPVQFIFNNFFPKSVYAVSLVTTQSVQFENSPASINSPCYLDRIVLPSTDQLKSKYKQTTSRFLLLLLRLNATLGRTTSSDMFQDEVTCFYYLLASADSSNWGHWTTQSRGLPENHMDILHMSLQSQKST